MQMYLAQAASDVVESAPVWTQIVYAVVTALIGAFVLPYLKRQSEKARAEADAANATAKEKLMARVKSLALDEAYIIAEERLPHIAQKALEKKLDKDGIKKELRSWGGQLKERLINYFKESDGTDLMVVVGDKILDDIVRWAADKTSPFPGKETAVALLQDDWSNRLVKYGAQWVREHWLSQKGD
jgi:hypothetical protein